MNEEDSNSNSPVVVFCEVCGKIMFEGFDSWEVDRDGNAVCHDCWDIHNMNGIRR